MLPQFHGGHKEHVKLSFMSGRHFMLTFHCWDDLRLYEDPSFCLSFSGFVVYWETIATFFFLWSFDKEKHFYNTIRHCHNQDVILHESSQNYIQWAPDSMWNMNIKEFKVRKRFKGNGQCYRDSVSLNGILVLPFESILLVVTHSKLRPGLQMVDQCC